VVADGITFSWVDDVNALKFRSSDPALEVKPGVKVIEEHELLHGSLVWRSVVTEHSYTGHSYATDLPSLAQHLQAVDKVLAKRSK
jgi:hypothetical protein